MRTTTLGAVMLAAALLAGTTGCADPKPQDAPAQESSEGTSPESAETSRVKDYRTLEELTADSDLIITGTVTEVVDTVDVNGMAFKRREVIPNEVLKGEAPDPLMVMDFGESALTGALEPGTTHLLFLGEYELNPGEATGDFVVTGGLTGDYVQDAEGSFIRTDHESPQLPERIPADEVAQRIG